MKLASVHKLVGAVEAKAGVAKTRLAEIRNRKNALLEAAARLDEDARSVMEGALNDAADFAWAARRQSALESQATARRAEASALDPEIQTCREALRSALREEIAWRRLERRLDTELRLRRSSREEERREATVLQSRN